MSDGVKLGSNPWSAGLIPPALSRRQGRDGGELRIWSCGDQIAGGDVLRVAGELPHPVVQVVGHGDTRNDADELDSGGRSSDGVGFDVTVHERRSWWRR